MKLSKYYHLGFPLLSILGFIAIMNSKLNDQINSFGLKNEVVLYLILLACSGYAFQPKKLSKITIGNLIFQLGALIFGLNWITRSFFLFDSKAYYTFHKENSFESIEMKSTYVLQEYYFPFLACSLLFFALVAFVVDRVKN